MKTIIADEHPGFASVLKGCMKHKLVSYNGQVLGIYIPLTKKEVESLLSEPETNRLISTKVVMKKKMKH